MKPKHILCLALVLSGGLTASALMIEMPVEPNNLDQGNYIFSVSTNSAQGGTAFHITVTAKKSFSPDSHIGLGIIQGENIVSIQPTNLTPQVALKKDHHSWKIDFFITSDFEASDFWMSSLLNVENNQNNSAAPPGWNDPPPTNAFNQFGVNNRIHLHKLRRPVDPSIQVFIF